jgi:hypothetical protein
MKVCDKCGKNKKVHTAKIEWFDSIKEIDLCFNCIEELYKFLGFDTMVTSEGD